MNALDKLQSSMLDSSRWQYEGQDASVHLVRKSVGLHNSSLVKVGSQKGIMGGRAAAVYRPNSGEPSIDNPRLAFNLGEDLGDMAAQYTLQGYIIPVTPLANGSTSLTASQVEPDYRGPANGAKFGDQITYWQEGDLVVYVTDEDGAKAGAKVYFNTAPETTEPNPGRFTATEGTNTELTGAVFSEDRSNAGLIAIRAQSLIGIFEPAGG